MQRNFKLILSIVVVLLAGALAFGQEEKVEYKDVVLDGKPAKLNVVTGEITLVDPKPDKKPEVSTADDFEKEEINSNFHIVEENETLLDIANRYNTTLTELKRVNNLESTLVEKGQKLQVRNFDVVEIEEAKPEVLTQPSKSKAKTKSSSDFHIVEKGQTLYSLANRYGLTVSELKQQNDLTSNLIKVGQELRVANFNSNIGKSDLSVWTVSKGDTLYSIAKKNGLSVEQLKSLNGLTSNLIKVGQVLRLQ
ncbi:LysM peptidoglycan-binding domain-containing protein [Winogradskyella sp. MIT101101]|uniref:LysM peptidoglycan-binding domain-containing protein n=1 Tax=Winogradskyella sp. MIT101101 TaxID=3098297 RepID=UPI00399C1D4B